jgi:hypothetical protein
MRDRRRGLVLKRPRPVKYPERQPFPEWVDYCKNSPWIDDMTHFRGCLKHALFAVTDLVTRKWITDLPLARLAIPTWGEGWHNDTMHSRGRIVTTCAAGNSIPSVAIIRLLERLGFAWDFVDIDDACLRRATFGRLGRGNSKQNDVLGVDPDALARVRINEPRELHDRASGGNEDRALDIGNRAVDSVAIPAEDGYLRRGRRLG